MTERKWENDCSVVLPFKCQLGMLCGAGSSLQQAAVKHVRIVYICLRFYPGRFTDKEAAWWWSSEVSKSLSLPRSKGQVQTSVTIGRP